MKRLLILPIFAPLLIAACVPIEPTCGGQALATETIFTKEGFPIIIEPALSAPCVVVTPPNVSTPPVIVPPVSEPPTPPVTPPTDKVKGNNGHGNLDDPAPGNSGSHNNAENSGNSGNGNSGNGKGGKPFDPPNNN